MMMRSRARALLCLVVLLSWLSCDAGDEHDGHKNEGGHEGGHEEGHEERVWQALYLAAGILALIIVPQVGCPRSLGGRRIGRVKEDILIVEGMAVAEE